jgi:hypothetical protein
MEKSYPSAGKTIQKMENQISFILSFFTTLKTEKSVPSKDNFLLFIFPEKSRKSNKFQYKILWRYCWKTMFEKFGEISIISELNRIIFGRSLSCVPR